MRIVKYLNTSEKEVYSKQLNIIIGISLGNKYFTKENVRDYLFWAIANTKERIAVLIPDKIHAVNYEVRSGYKKERAQKRAICEGEKVIYMVKSILGELSLEKQAIVDILKWEEIETKEYKRMVAILYDEFKNNSQFRDKIIEIVKEYMTSEKYNDSDYEKLATYPIEELPMLVAGINYNGRDYNLLPYPGISKIDDLKIGLQEGTIFPEIAEKLNMKNKLRLIEAYAE
jgi:tRNA-dependent cyclodipeptide synthase